MKITIGQQTINLGGSGADANWGVAWLQFAQAVADQLASIASQFDISPRVQILTSDANTNIDITSVVFPSGSVRSFNFNYAVYRTNGVLALSEQGFVNGVYNDLTATWDIQHDFMGEKQSDGSPYHTFNMSGDQLQFSSVAIGGAYNNTESKLSYAAKTTLVSDL